MKTLYYTYVCYIGGTEQWKNTALFEDIEIAKKHSEELAEGMANFTKSYVDSDGNYAITKFVKLDESELVNVDNGVWKWKTP